MKLVELLLAAALCALDWIQKGMTTIGFVLESWRTRIRRCRELRLAGKAGER